MTLTMPAYPVILVPVTDNDGAPFHLPDLLQACGLEALALAWEAIVKGLPLRGDGVWYEDGTEYTDNLVFARVALPLVLSNRGEHPLAVVQDCARTLAREARQVCVAVWYPPGTDAPPGSIPLVALDPEDFDADPTSRGLAHTRVHGAVLVSASDWGSEAQHWPRAGALALVYPA